MRKRGRERTVIREDKKKITNFVLKPMKERRRESCGGAGRVGCEMT